MDNYSADYTPIGPLNNYGNPMGGDVVNIDGNLVGKNSDTYLNLLQAHDSPEDALAWLKGNNPEVYYQLLAERDQNRAFWEEYKKYQENYYSTQKESLLKAGMNPWLALQNFGSIGTGTVGSSSSVNPTNTLKAQREAKSYELGGKAIGAVGAVIGAVIGALVMAML